MRGTPRPFRQWKINSATLAVCQLSTDEGQIQIKHGDEWVDLVTAPARKVVEIRKTTVGWVSQFLRVIPRISALEVVMQPLLDTGVPREPAPLKPRVSSPA